MEVVAMTNNELCTQIIRYENGELTTTDELVDLFQSLINSGLAWSLQGAYGRTAFALIGAGLCTKKERAQ